MSPYVGSLIGFFLFSSLADNWGRKPSIGLSWLVASVGGIIMWLSPNWELAALGYFLAGLGVNPAITI